MAGTSHTTPAANEADETSQQEKQPQTYNEKLAADFYKDYSSQNAVAIQVILALSSGGVGYGREVIGAYNLLKKPLDPKKLIEDPEYKRQVERAMQLVKRHEGSGLKEKGKSKYKVEVNRTETALGQVKKIHDDQIKIKTSFSGPYIGTLKSLYGLDDTEIKSVLAGANKRLIENPTLSMQDALRLEARAIIRKKIAAEANKDPSFKKLNKKQKEEEINSSLKAREEEYKTNTASTQTYENGRCEALRQDGKRQVAQTLGVDLKPTAPVQTVPQTQTTPSSIQPTPPSTPTTQPTAQPAQASQPTIQPSTLLTPQPQLSTTKSPVPSSIRRAIAGPMNIKQISGKAISNYVINLRQQFFNRAAKFAFRMPLAKPFLKLARNGLAFGLRSLRRIAFRTGIKAFASAARLGLTLLKGGVSAALGAASLGTTVAIQAGLALLKKLTGIDIDGMVVNYAKRAALVAVGVPIAVMGAVVLIGLYLFPIKDSGPMALHWQQFEKEYLIAKTEDNRTYSNNWQQFEKDNLIPPHKFLSSNPE